MNSEYINKDNLVELFLDKFYGDGLYKLDFSDVIRHINSFPADTDVIKVVRCEHCSKSKYITSTNRYCRVHAKSVHNDDYCSFGSE